MKEKERDIDEYTSNILGFSQTFWFLAAIIASYLISQGYLIVLHK